MNVVAIHISANGKSASTTELSGDQGKFLARTVKNLPDEFKSYRLDDFTVFYTHDGNNVDYVYEVPNELL